MNYEEESNTQAEVEVTSDEQENTQSLADFIEDKTQQQMPVLESDELDGVFGNPKMWNLEKDEDDDDDDDTDDEEEIEPFNPPRRMQSVTLKIYYVIAQMMYGMREVVEGKDDGSLTVSLRSNGNLYAQIIYRQGKDPNYFIEQDFYQDHSPNSSQPRETHINLGVDDRGYQFECVKFNPNKYPDGEDPIRILAGCRDFSIPEAKEHWKDNREVLPRIMVAEAIAIFRGWIEAPELKEGVSIEETARDLVNRVAN